MSRWMPPRSIRPIAIGIIRSGNRILVSHGYDASRGHHFYRPLGGAIEFGERAEDALRREFREELRAELASPSLIGVSENLFTYEGEPAHEIVFVFHAEFADASLYQQDDLVFHEDGREDRSACWVTLEELANPVRPLYPVGLLELLTNPE